MKARVLLIISCGLLAAQTGFGQTECDFPIDTARILGNKNTDSFIYHLKNDKFNITNDKKDIPAFIQKELDCYAGGFIMANIDEPYQATDVIIKEGLPRRKLTFLAKSSNVLVMQYKLGGMGISFHLVLIRFDKDKIVDLWKGGYSDGFEKINDVVKYLTYYVKRSMRKHEDYIDF